MMAGSMFISICHEDTATKQELSLLPATDGLPLVYSAQEEILQAEMFDIGLAVCSQPFAADAGLMMLRQCSSAFRELPLLQYVLHPWQE